jgi:hypothetical protein
MVFWPPYLWNIDPPYPWYFDPPIHEMSTPYPMVYWSPYPWYFDPPTHDILISLPISWLEMGGQNTMGVQFTIQRGQFSIRGFNIPWMKIDPVVNLPWSSKYHMTPVICPRLSHNGPRRCLGQYNLPWAIMTNIGHITGPLWKHPFINTII